jgi:hypothetical protein
MQKDSVIRLSRTVCTDVDVGAIVGQHVVSRVGMKEASGIDDSPISTQVEEGSFIPLSSVSFFDNHNFGGPQKPARI